MTSRVAAGATNRYVLYKNKGGHAQHFWAFSCEIGKPANDAAGNDLQRQKIRGDVREGREKVNKPC